MRIDVADATAEQRVILNKTTNFLIGGYTSGGQALQLGKNACTMTQPAQRDLPDDEGV